MSFESFIGGRYLRARPKQAFISLITILSVAGVTVGVMALVVVIAVMTGAESDFRARILGVEPHVVVMRHGGRFTDYGKVTQRITDIEGVQSASPFVYNQVMLRSSSGVSGAVLRGINPESISQNLNNQNLPSLQNIFPRLSGQLNKDRGKASMPGIVLGKELAGILGVFKGDTVYLISPRGMISPIGHVPSMKRFKVVGLFESGFYEYDQSLAYIHIKDAQRTLRMGDSVTGVGVRVKDIYQADGVKKKITAELGFPYWARDWMQMNKNLFSALKLEKKAMFVILTLIVLVAAFNIASSLIMMVMQKTKDIAILKAMGATDKSIKKIFIFKGMVIGSVGTFLGLGLGFLLCWLLKHYKFIELPGDVYYFTTLPVKLEYLDVFLIAAASLLICFLATLYPARQAAKLNPVEAIRYDSNLSMDQTPPSETVHLIDARGLCKGFNNSGARIEILKEIDLTLNPGETLAVVGASGIGKSTLLHILGTLDQPDSGRLYFNGEDVFLFNDKKRATFRNRAIGFVFQFHHLLPEFSAIENAMMPSLICGENRQIAGEAAESILVRVGLKDDCILKSENCRAVNSSELPWLDSLVLKPDVLLADEPTGNLDKGNSEQVHNILMELNQELKMALVVVTHNMELAAYMSRTATLIDGHLSETS